MRISKRANRVKIGHEARRSCDVTGAMTTPQFNPGVSLPQLMMEMHNRHAAPSVNLSTSGRSAKAIIAIYSIVTQATRLGATRITLMDEVRWGKKSSRRLCDNQSTPQSNDQGDVQISTSPQHTRSPFRKGSQSVIEPNRTTTCPQCR